MSPLRVEITEEGQDGTMVTTIIENGAGFTVSSCLAALITGLPKTSLFRAEKKVDLRVRRETRGKGNPRRVYTDADLIRLANLSPRAEVEELGRGLVSVGVTTHPENTLVHSVLRRKRGKVSRR